MDKVQEIQNERNILSKLSHPNIVKLHSSFHDAKNVYMVMDYAINGDFAAYLKLNSKRFLTNLCHRGTNRKVSLVLRGTTYKHPSFPED